MFGKIVMIIEENDTHSNGSRLSRSILRME